MKQIKKNVISLFLVIVLTIISTSSFCQGPPTPPTGSGHGSSGNQHGGNAPIGSGLFIMLGMAGFYSTRKLLISFNLKD